MTALSSTSHAEAVSIENAPPPPLVPGLPILGNALQMAADTIGFLVKSYQQYGSAYRIRLLNREIVVLAGIEANNLLQKEEDLLSSWELFGAFGEEYGTRRSMSAIDGAPHRHQRKLMRRGFARSAAVPHVPKMIDLTREAVAGLEPGVIEILPVVRRLIVDQLSFIFAGKPPGALYEDLRTVAATNISVHVMKTSPRVMMQLPGYRAAFKRTVEFSLQLIEERRARGPSDPPDLLDDLLSAVDENGQPYEAGWLLNAVTGPYFAGMDTAASTLGFMLYAILKHPDVYEAITAEADALFANGAPSMQDLKNAKTLYGATVETLRLYPIAIVTPRTTTRAVNFAGYRIDAGQEVYMANGVTHFLPEFYADPMTFDVTRFEGEKLKATHAYAPYSLGAHTCLGAGLAEMQIMLTAAALLHAGRWSLVNPSDVMRIAPTPIPNPGKFKVRFVAHR